MTKKAQRYLNRLGLHLERARQRLRRSGFSNFDEERMLAELVARLVTEESARVAVDVGAGDGIRGSNTYALFAASASRATKSAHAASPAPTKILRASRRATRS